MKKLGATFEFYNRMNILIYKDENPVEALKMGKEATSPSIVVMLWGRTKGRTGPDKSRENKDRRPEKLEGAHGGFEINKGTQIWCD